TAKALADALTAWLGETPAAPPARRKSWLWGFGALVLGTASALFGLIRN
ncbi:MAG: hypothetical protein HY293_22930, partial [Planctomycetes bacterium]|nr:hypothetical protein [Planctomycetota bacterium]